VQYTLTELLGNAEGATFTLANNTVVTITSREVTKLRLGKVAAVPLVFALRQNYPNPFNPSTTIHYEVPGLAVVQLVVYDILGREVTTLVDEMKTAGAYDINFNTIGLASGVYFYRMQAGDFVGTKKMVLMK
jgi:hypothetical protein